MPDPKWFKGRAAVAIDAFYSKNNDYAANLTAAYEQLNPGTGFAQIVSNLGAGWDAGEFPYPDRDGGVLHGTDFEAVAWAGYLKAIELAFRHRPTPVPIETFWMTGAGNPNFEMHVSDGPQHVTVTLLVPTVDGGSPAAGMPEAWVTKVGPNGQVQTSQTSGPPRAQ